MGRKHHSVGLRCPSEIAALRWGDVNWKRGRLMVRSVKTEGHEGHAVRVVPIAPECARSCTTCSMRPSREAKR
jgi:integrase